MRLIGFSKIHLSTFYPIFASICYITRQYSLTLIKNNEKEYPILFQEFLIFPGEMLCGVLYLILKKSTSIDVSDKSRRRSTYKQLTFTETQKQNPIKIYLIFLGITMFDIIGFFLILYFSNIDGIKNSSEIESGMKILGYFFFKFKLHRHHYFGLILIFIGIIFMSFKYFIESFNVCILLLIVSNCLYSLMEIIEKWLMDIQYVSVYKLIFIEGTYGTIIMVIVILISNTVCNSNIISSIGKLFSTDYTYYIQMLLYILATLGYNVFIDLINKTSGPTHRVVSDTLTSIIRLILSFIVQQNKYVFLAIIGDILIVLGSIIFNEIIIIYICNLEESTKEEIIKREREETTMHEEDNNLKLIKDNIIPKEDLIF